MSAGLRISAPEDFVVEEIPLFEPSGWGGHTLVWVEKRLRTTDEVARWLAARAGVPARDVGYAGRKDRFALTRQRFSVPGLPPEDALALSWPGVRILEAARHRSKLRTGQLAGNRFELHLPRAHPEMREAAVARAREIARIGMPNRFGPQRFGRDGENVDRGRRLLQGAPTGRMDRRSARFLCSAFQAAVFNEVLRTRPLPIDRVEEGDLARRTDSGGLFRVEDVEAENARAARFEISATGPIFGTRMEQPGPAVAARERAVLEAFGIEATRLRAPRGVRLRGGRRPLRVPVRDLRLDEMDQKTVGSASERAASGTLRLSFALPPGSYATVLVESLLGVEIANALADSDAEAVEP